MRKSTLATFGDGESFIYGEIIYFTTTLEQNADGVQFYAHVLFVRRNDQLINITNDYGMAVNHGVRCGDRYVTNNGDARRLVQKLGDQAFLNFNAFAAEQLY